MINGVALAMLHASLPEQFADIRLLAIYLFSYSLTNVLNVWQKQL